jgi:hypothetical protein
MMQTLRRNQEFTPKGASRDRRPPRSAHKLATLSRYRQSRWKMVSCDRSADHPSVCGNIFGAACSTNNDKRDTARRLTNNFGVAFLLKIYDERPFLIHKPPHSLYHAAAKRLSDQAHAPAALRAAPWRYFEMGGMAPAAWPLVWLSEGPAKLLAASRDVVQRILERCFAEGATTRCGAAHCLMAPLVHPAAHTFVYDNETCVSRGFAYI